MALSGPGGGARGTFGRMGFILAAAGSAVGLGNLWRFPYMAHKNGGGSFVLIYLIAALSLGIPIMLAEISIGRSTNSNPVTAFRKLGGKLWSLVGWLGIGTGFIILSYYCVVAGWTVKYTVSCIGWSLGGFGEETAANLPQMFGDFVASGTWPLILHALFMIATAGVIVFGVAKGIEKVTKILMPVLFMILLILVLAAATTASFGEALTHLFTPGKITQGGVLEAVGQAFFSMSLGMGAMITYGSYMSRKESAPRSALIVGGLDTLVALMASVIMFTIIFAMSAEEQAGLGASAGIMFTTLPKMLYGMPAGVLLAPLFFVLVCFAALTSTISLLEVLVSWFIDELKWSRKAATVTMATAAFALGVPAALSFGAVGKLSSFQLFGTRATGYFDHFDFLASNFCLPLGGLLIACFAGWYLSSFATRKETEEGHGRFHLHGLWRVMLRFTCPVAIGWILYAVLFEGVQFN